MRAATEHPPRHWHINVNEAWEVAFWSKELECSEVELRAAVEAVGNRSMEVRGFLEEVHRRLPDPGP
jgi:hypothetical protein